MSGRGRPRKDALNIRRSKRKAEATEKPKRQKREEETVENRADHEVDQDHEVEETISLGGVGSEHQGGSVARLQYTNCKMSAAAAIFVQIPHFMMVLSGDAHHTYRHSKYNCNL